MGKIEPSFTATVTVTGGRGGHAVSDDGVLDVQLRPPKQRGVNDGTNPEQLFAAAWGGCFQSALLGIARAEGVDASGSTVTVEVAVGPDADGNYGLAARIAVAVPGLSREAVQQLADAAHERCPYSRATRGNIEVEVEVTALG
jgi:osmotically inducible protein OsmC